jgi:hypothetical protein
MRGDVDKNRVLSSCPMCHVRLMAPGFLSCYFFSLRTADTSMKRLKCGVPERPAAAATVTCA